MRILAIRGKNLASLRGEFALELNQPPLAHAGLFAITGHTGAGKSTLLDAMCLALFDKVPRLIGAANVRIGRPNEDEKQRVGSSDVGSILSRGTASGYAEVDFVGLDKHTYRAHWEIKRARNRVSGRLQKQSITLRDLDSEKIIGQHKGDTLEAISDRIGLNFEQFRRSVLLAQGDFAAFLKARSDERSGLLERITGTEIYSRLSIAAYRQFQEQDQRLNQIKEKLVLEQPLENQQRQDLLIAIQELGDQFKDIQNSIDSGKALMDWHDANKRLELDKQATEAVLTKLIQEKDAREAQSRELEQVISVQGLRTLDNACEQLNNKILRLESQLSAAKLEQQQAKDTETSLSVRVETARQRLTEHETAFAKLKPEILQARELDTQIKLTHQARVEQKTRVNELRSELHTLRSKAINVDELKHEQADIEKQLGRLNRQLQELLLAKAETSLEQLNQEKDRAEKQLQQSQKAHDIHRVFLGKNNELNNIITETKARAKEIQQLHHNLSDSEKLQAHTAIAIEEARRALLLMQESVTQGAQSLRGLLKPYQPCPVCGGTEHPWAGQGTQLIEQYEQQKARVAELDKSLYDCNREISRLQQAVKHANREQQQYQGQINDLKSELQDLQRQWQVVTAAIDHQADLSDAVNGEFFAAEIKTIIKTLDTIRSKEKQAIATQAAIDDCHLKKEQFLSREKELTSLVSEQQILTNSIDNMVRQLDNNTGNLEKRSALEKQLQYQRQQMLSGQDADAVETNNIESIKRWSKQYEQEKQALEQARQQQLGSIQQCQSLQQQLDGLHIEQKNCDNELLKALRNRSLNRTQLKILLAKDDNWIQQRQQELNEFSNQIIKNETLLAERQLKLQQHKQLLQRFDQQFQELSYELLQAQWLEQRQQQQQLQELRQEKTLELRQDDRRKQRLLAVQDELETQQKLWYDWGAINELIGSANGNKFRTFAQSLTLETLLAHANTHLNDFARRYQLQRVPDTDLELQIVDRDMADEVRSVQSLSGGESFLVSLALALGLASLSSSRTQVESLFIDEGFGTLDQETLDIAIASLDTLQGMGRKVGIISHVPILVERIGTRVLVKKMGSGQSRVIVES